jgi:chemotaxis protein methyltransferase CheR
MISEFEYRLLTDYLEARHALAVPATNASRLGGFVAQRMHFRERSFPDYLDTLTTDREETGLIIDAATIGETYFFRDESHFSLLLNEFLPFFAGLGKIPRAWSAATSTGEEALSIAVLYAQFYGLTESLAGHLWASDINSISLSNLRRGTYRNHSLREDGRKFHPDLEPWIARGDGSFVVDPRILSLVEARTINLMTDSYDVIPGQVDILFLKNMMIYFPLERRKPIYQKISAKLSPQGFLVLGKSEIPFFESPSMRMIERGGNFFCIPRSSSFPDFIRRQV